MPSFIRFNRKTRELTVAQSSDIKSGLYKVFIDGYLEDFPETKDYIKGQRNLTVEVICEAQILTPNSPAVKFSYYVGWPAS